MVYCPGGRIAEVETRKKKKKKLHNFGGTGMQEKDKRETVIFSRVGAE